MDIRQAIEGGHSWHNCVWEKKIIFTTNTLSAWTHFKFRYIYIIFFHSQGFSYFNSIRYELVPVYWTIKCYHTTKNVQLNYFYRTQFAFLLFLEGVNVCCTRNVVDNNNTEQVILSWIQVLILDMLLLHICTAGKMSREFHWIEWNFINLVGKRCRIPMELLNKCNMQHMRQTEISRTVYGNFFNWK